MSVQKLPGNQRARCRTPSILLIEDDLQARNAIHAVLAAHYECERACDGTEALERIREQLFDCVLLDCQLSGEDPLILLKSIKRLCADLPVIGLCDSAETLTAVKAVRAGATDFIIKEIESTNVAERIERAIGQRAVSAPSRSSPPSQPCPWTPGQMLVGNSRRMQEVMRVARRVAHAPVPILIQGESGTGKELMARWLHRMSGRAKSPFEAVNLAAIPTDLIESTLFGHERGAFTGAAGQRKGKFELARDGTLFLDEITELKLELQPKLLRVLQEGEYERVGGDRTLYHSARIITATNRNIHNDVQEGTFRGDLYYRINVITITLPPLRERRKDIPDFVHLFIAKYNHLYGRSILGICPEAMKELMRHHWPGNIRELENMIQRAVIVARDTHATLDDLMDRSVCHCDRVTEQIATMEGTLEDLERLYIEEILRRTDGHQGHAAKILGIDRKTLYNKIMKYGLRQSLSQKTG